MPEDPALPLMRIPYLRSSRANDKRLLDHPVFRNHAVTEEAFDLPFLEDYKAQPMTIFAMVQSIWFFGLIKDVFQQVWQIPFKKGDFVREDEGEQLITTASFSNCVKQFARGFEKHSTAVQADLVESAHKIITSFAQQISTVTGSFRFKIAAREFRRGQDIMCSIYITAELISAITAEVSGMSTSYWLDGRFTYLAEDEFQMKWPEQQSLRERLAQIWCPNEVEHIVKTFSLRSQYYVSNLQRDGNTTYHRSCSTSACRFQSSGLKPQKPKHRLDGCSCPLVGTPNGRVEMALHAGKIPKLHIAPMLPMKTTDNQCEVMESGKYVAITHVWSHGAGNAKANELPQCQLLFLQRQIQCLYPPNHSPVQLWLDTLCIPAETEGKKIGLKLLKKAFDGADKVLVIDRDLLQVGNASSTEILYRINCSAWMRRLWTLNEAVVSSRKLYVQLSRRAVTFPELARDQRFERDTLNEQGLQLGVYDEVSGNFGRIWQISKKRSIDGRFARLLPALHRRLTTEQSDEIICIASALNIPVDPFLDCPSENRMRTLIPMLGKIPSSVIFTDAPILKEVGFRWALTTFLTGEFDCKSTLRSNDFEATWTGLGIAVQLCGFKLLVNMDSFLADFSPGYFYLFNEHEDRWSYANLVVSAAPSNGEVKGPQQFQYYALLTYPSIQQRRAILVAVYDDRGKCFKASVLGRYNMGLLRNSFEKCAAGIKRNCRKDGIQLEANTSTMSAEKQAALKEIDLTHHGLFSVGISCVIAEILTISMVAYPLRSSFQAVFRQLAEDEISRLVTHAVWPHATGQTGIRKRPPQRAAAKGSVAVGE